MKYILEKGKALIMGEEVDHTTFSLIKYLEFKLEQDTLESSKIEFYSIKINEIKGVENDKIKIKKTKKSA